LPSGWSVAELQALESYDINIPDWISVLENKLPELRNNSVDDEGSPV
jgi:hypothetical protein